MSNSATGTFDKIRWVPVCSPVLHAGSPLPPVAEPIAEENALLPEEHPTIAFLRTTDLPLPPFLDGVELTAKAWAIFLLQAAAEVEHQFIVQYLYAGYCGNAASPVFTPANSRQMITIAKEEMGHLLTVQNLLLLLNAPPYLNRLTPSFAGFEPFPLSLEPFSLKFVTRFLVAESPAHPDPLLPGTVEADLGGVLTLKDIRRVGSIYAMLDWLLETTADRETGGSAPPDDPYLTLQLTEGDLIDPQNFTAMLNTADSWSAFGSIHVLPRSTEPLITREDLRLAARAAIRDVSAQGEGPASGNAQSHYGRLLTLYTALKADTSGTLPEGNFVTDPKTEGDAAVTPGLITNPDTLLLAKKSDAAYQTLLTCIALSVATSDTDFRTATAKSAVNEIMRTFLRAAAQDVTGQPFAAGAALTLAGPPFTPPPPFPFQPAALPGDTNTEKALCQRLLDEIAHIQADFVDVNLTDLKTLTEKRLAALGV